MEAKTTITDLCYDCLERIFSFLDLESLLNVAYTCKSLQNVAATQFDAADGETPIFLQPYFSLASEKSEICRNFEVIKVIGLKLNLQFLRCFGEKITYLALLRENEYVDRYINQYCVHTLIGFDVVDRWEISNEIFVKPFNNVIDFGIHGCKLGKNSLKLDQLFPNLRALSMKFVDIDAMDTALHLPFLKDLNIKACKIYSENYERLLQACPRLKTLTIHAEEETTLDELLDVIIENKSILNLLVDFEVTSVNEFALRRLTNEHPSLETLQLWRQGFTADAAIMLTQQLNHLKKFKFRVDSHAEYHRLRNNLGVVWETIYLEVPNVNYTSVYVTLNR